MVEKREKQKKKKNYRYPDKTTIQISKEHAKMLDSLRAHKRESNDAVLSRLFANQADVYVEFVLVDNELPQIHTIVFQLGEDKTSLYYWDGSTSKPFSLEEANKLLKMPKPKLEPPK